MNLPRGSGRGGGAPRRRDSPRRLTRSREAADDARPPHARGRCGGGLGGGHELLGAGGGSQGRRARSCPSSCLARPLPLPHPQPIASNPRPAAPRRRAAPTGRTGTHTVVHSPGGGWSRIPPLPPLTVPTRAALFHDSPPPRSIVCNRRRGGGAPPRTAPHRVTGRASSSPTETLRPPSPPPLNHRVPLILIFVLLICASVWGPGTLVCLFKCQY